MHIILIGIGAHRAADGTELRDVPDGAVLFCGSTQTLVDGLCAEWVELIVLEAKTCCLIGGKEVGIGIFVREMVEQTVCLILRVVVDDGRNGFLLVGRGVVIHIIIYCRRTTRTFPIMMERLPFVV